MPTSELERIIGPYVNEATSISMCSPDLRKEERRELLRAVVQGACLAAVKAFAANLDHQIEWSDPDYPVFQRVLAKWTQQEAPTKEDA